MKNKSQLLLICLLTVPLFLTSSHVNAQRRGSAPWGYGASVIYNFQAAGLGADLRVRIPVVNRMFFVPEVSYFPPFNRYHDLYAGGAFHYEVLTIRNYNLYVLGAAYYNNWINAEDFAPEQKKKNNFDPEAGLGLVKNRGCWRPFIENRYGFKWKEDNLRIGIYYYPGQCGKSRRKEKCPPVRV
jgi:hypothetical protein